jgi:hypothetical protein
LWAADGSTFEGEWKDNKNVGEVKFTDKTGKVFTMKK